MIFTNLTVSFASSPLSVPNHLFSQDFPSTNRIDPTRVFSFNTNEPPVQDVSLTENSFSFQLPENSSPQLSNSQPCQPSPDSFNDGETPTNQGSTVPATLAEKRHRNNVAARKYRQKRIDRIEELELALAKMTRERDELKVQLAKRDGEVDLLKEMFQQESS
jgi:hypothetical protein